MSANLQVRPWPWLLISHWHAADHLWPLKRHY